MRATRRQLEPLITALLELRSRAIAFEHDFREEIQKVHPSHVESARNLLHYLALRQGDLRELQVELASLGLSSLGRMESHTLATLDAVISAVRAFAAGGKAPRPMDDAPCDFVSGNARLISNTHSLLGPRPFRRPVHIMVTMPSEAATEPQLVHELLASGMDVMRINCAHDTPEDWRAMIRHLREAEQSVGRSCKVYVDLPGPKLRTGRLPAGVQVRKLKVKRNLRGEVLEPQLAWLTPAKRPESRPAGVRNAVPFEGTLLDGARPGDELLLVDARGRKRRLRIHELQGESCLATYERPIYVETGLAVTRSRKGKRVGRGAIGTLPEVTEPMRVHPGDRLILMRENLPARPALVEGGRVVQPMRIHCSLPDIFDQVRVDESVWFDDGKIGARIESVNASEMSLLITHTDPRGGRLRANKGINFPDSQIDVPALTATDLADLTAVVEDVDIVGLSFVRRAEDVELLREHLRERRAEDTSVVLKIENRSAFDNLPHILLAAMRYRSAGIMVARGDLAVEVGFERLSEVQEEILWICEAAHVPVIWATQVLESLAKKGRPSRAEVTDAAMGVRAECVMLNKGPYAVQAVEFLTGVLVRMNAHQAKKRTMLRPLSISRLRPAR